MFKKLVAAAALVAVVSSCAWVTTAKSRIESTPAGQSVLQWVEAFKPKVDAAIAKVHAGLALSPEDVKFLCGGANALDTAFNVAVLFVQIPSGGVELERLGFKGVQGACAVAQGGQLPEIKALVGFVTETQAVLKDAGVTK